VSILNIKEKIALLPTEPGCYLMRNQSDEIIYVGKAKNLKNRVKSYFVGAHNEKTTRLVAEIVDFSYVVTNSEHESLILELNLIKEHVPKYNIRYVDDKSYPYIELTEETHPRLDVVRQKDVKGRVFGPYPNVYSARETVRLLNRLFPIRKCENMPKKACLYYHIGQCLAPCIKKDVQYGNDIDLIIRFLKGDTKDVMNLLTTEMEKASIVMNYEKAAEYRDMMNHIQNTTEKQIINLNDFKDRDAISYAFTDDDIAIQILMMRQGKIIDHHQVVFSYVGQPFEAVMGYLEQYYEKIRPEELLFDILFEEEAIKSRFGKQALIPLKGDKRKVVMMASKNAKYDLEHHAMLFRHKEEYRKEALAALSNIIGHRVRSIDVFDNAQLFGTAPISACIVSKDGGFEKKSYRKYHLKTTTNDDYQAMKEVIYRRYQKMLVQKDPLPDLILVDGGLGQLNAAHEILDQLAIETPVAGLKKNHRHQLDALIFKDEVHALKKQDQLYKFLGALSEEVHRYAIDFHRKTRQKRSISSPLDQINGMGEKRKKLLLKHFKSMDTLKNATLEEIINLGIPKNVAQQIKEVIK
jgi:excinuclease ABC subunit C